MVADVETHPDPEAPIGHVGGIWRTGPRDVIVKVNDEPSDRGPLIYTDLAVPKEQVT